MQKMLPSEMLAAFFVWFPNILKEYKTEIGNRDH
jgi:hypothetical protein